MTRARNTTRPGSRSGSRTGFTLVELLVVLGLILALLGIVLAVNSSGITDSYKATSAADRVSGWLLIAKSKAQRDKAPRGVRLLLGPNNQIRDAQFIEVPDSYTPPPLNPASGVMPRLLIAPAQNGSNKRVFVTPDANLTDLTQSVFVNDVLYLPEFNTLHTITALILNPTSPPPPPGVPPNSLEVVVRNPAVLPAVPGATGVTFATNLFGFHRQAQPAIGEPTLQLTGDMVIDAGTGMSRITPNPVTNEFDVLFAPNGELLNAASGSVILWVRDVRLPTPRPVLPGPINPGQATYTDNRTTYEAAGQMALIVVYSKTGAIATQPVTMPQTTTPVTGHNPYSATTDAVNTGL